MSSCYGPNTPLQRYVVRLVKEQGDISPLLTPYTLGLKILPQIVMVEGLTEGEQGTIELRERGKVFKVPDTVREITALKLQLRVDSDAEGKLVRYLFDEWWVNRDEVVCNFFVHLTDRSWCALETYIFYGCTMQGRSEPQRVLGTPTIGVIDMTFLPYDVEKLNNAELLANAAGF